MRNRLGSGKPCANGGTELTLIGYFTTMANDAMLVQQVTDSSTPSITYIRSSNKSSISMQSYQLAFVCGITASTNLSDYRGDQNCYFDIGVGTPNGLISGRAFTYTVSYHATGYTNAAFYETDLTLSSNMRFISDACQVTHNQYVHAWYY